MTQKFCENHILAFFKGWQNSQCPLDLALSDYYRSHKSLGSHDRKYIGEAVYTLVRWKSLFDELDPIASVSRRLHLLAKHAPEVWAHSDPSLSEAAKFGTSPFLFQKIIDTYGEEKGKSLAAILNSSAPVSVRANLLKISRDELLARWGKTFQVTAGKISPTAIIFAKREPLFTLPEFKEGLFEVQDEGSQVVASLVAAKSGDRVLDYCSGSGGKMLAVAPSMKGKGEMVLHDIRLGALREAQKRLKRAGIQNAQVLPPNHPTLKKLKGKMDWVLTDVPCSGTGTLRRNPDMKWKIDQAMVDRLVSEQRAIVQEAISYLKPGARLVYATCSILKEENQDQIDFFLKNLPLTLEQEPLHLLPTPGGCDGFFAAVLKKDRKE